MKSLFRAAFTLSVFLMLIWNGLSQSVPPLVNYQGRLANAAGSPLPTADYQLTFKIYDAATNGNLIWGPQIFDGQPALGHGLLIPVVQGYFNVMLGPADTNSASLANAFNAPNRFVEVTVTNNPPIAPRQQILSAPYAMMAGSVVAGSIQITNLAPRPVGTNVPAGGVAISPSTGSWNSPTPAQWTSVPALSVTITTTGRPVMILLSGDTSGSSSVLVGQTVSPTTAEVDVACLRDGLLTGSFEVQEDRGAQLCVVSPGDFSFLDTPPAGTHTYQIQVQGVAGSLQLNCGNVRLIVYEL